MKEKQLLEQMAKVVAEIQRINLWIDSATTNYIARLRYRKLKPALQELVETHKKLSRQYEALGKEQSYVPAGDKRGERQEPLPPQGIGEEADDKADKRNP